MTTFWIVLSIIIYIASAVVNTIIACDVTAELGSEMHEGHFVAILFPVINTISAIAFSIMIYREKKRSEAL